MITISPIQLQSLINAALFEITKHANNYSDETRNKIKELLRWVITIDWDEPTKQVIMIDEMPF